MSQDHNHLNHATWECKYHVVFTPKYRKLLFGQIRWDLDTRSRQSIQWRRKGKARSGLRRMWNASCAIFLTANSGRRAISFRPSSGTIRTYIKNQEIADKQLDQLQLKLASS